MINLAYTRQRGQVFLLIYYTLSALATVHIGNDNTLAALIRMPSYYSDLLLALSCSYAIGLYLHIVSRRLDKQVDESIPFTRKIFFLAVFGFLLPLIAAVTIEIVYLIHFLAIPLSESSIFYLEAPLIALFITGANLFYVVKSLHERNKQIMRRFQENTNMPEINGPKTHFTVQYGARYFSIRTSDIRYFILTEKTTFLFTRECKKYVVSGSLEKIFTELDHREFYQINRQVIANRDSIGCFEHTEARKLKITLTPPIEKDLYVSKAKAGSFIRWINEKAV